MNWSRSRSASPTGFLILDLHNLYCQIHNFGIRWQDLLANYPLEKVRELHVSGGSWGEAPSAPGVSIRRDTHDDAVPEEVHALLEAILPLCPNAEAVIFERALERLGVPANEVLHAGDHLTKDVEAAGCSGLQAVLVDHDRRHREFAGPRVESLDELSDYITSINPRAARCVSWRPAHPRA